MNLFAKIFIGFWLSTAAVIGSWILAAQYFDPPAAQSEMFRPPPMKGLPPPPDGRRPPLGGPMARPPRQIFQIYYGLQNVASEELQTWIEQQENSENIDIRLYDAEGEEIFGRASLVGTQSILDKLSGFRRRATHREGNIRLFGQEMYRPEWGQLNLVIAQRPPVSPVIAFLREHLWLRLLLALLISGLISYAVSRYLTGSLKNLQQASRALAEGDLNTRIKVSQRGGDETDELARDFNSMAEQLQEKIQAQKRLLSDVSHELRSPLARLRVALALAEKDPARAGEQLARIERETERLDELIGQLLSAPDTHIDFEDRIDLVILLESLCGDADYEARQQGKSVKFNSDLSELVIRSHGDLLNKALENVIRNAVKHTEDESVVEISLVQDNNSVMIQVADRGPGIPANALEKIFEPFYRLDESRQRETGGFGLGLSIARRAVEQHGGTIVAHNLPQGLCVTIHLPNDLTNA